MFKRFCNKALFEADIVFYATLTCLLWILSLTVLLPFVILLKFSQSTKDKVFPFIFVKIILRIFKPLFNRLRNQPFDLLKEHLSERDAKVPLRILEIGIGSGENLKFYPENSMLIALDKNKYFETYFEKNREQYPNVHFEKIILGMAEDMHELKSSSVDVVVSTFVLCYVTDISAVLKDVKRVLKPSGKFIFLEHVAFRKSIWRFAIQNWATPLWKLFSAGCHPNRHTTSLIESSGFSVFIHHYVERPFIPLWRTAINEAESKPVEVQMIKFFSSFVIEVKITRFMVESSSFWSMLPFQARHGG